MLSDTAAILKFPWLTVIEEPSSVPAARVSRYIQNITSSEASLESWAIVQPPPVTDTAPAPETRPTTIRSEFGDTVAGSTTLWLVAAEDPLVAAPPTASSAVGLIDSIAGNAI
jgi:hypothetical protein